MRLHAMARSCESQQLCLTFGLAPLLNGKEEKDCATVDSVSHCWLPVMR